MSVALVRGALLMLRITRLTGSDAAEPLLRLEGDVAGPWVDALRRACHENRPGGGGGRIVLDLGGVSFIDAAGIALFRELAADHAMLTNGSIYVAEQLREVVGHGNG
jgi:anti-anti-sigma regulatory factor